MERPNALTVVNIQEPRLRIVYVFTCDYLFSDFLIPIYVAIKISEFTTLTSVSFYILRLFFRASWAELFKVYIPL